LIALYTVEVQRFVVRRNPRRALAVERAGSRVSQLRVARSRDVSISSLWFVVHGLGVDLFGIIAALSRPLQAVGNSLPGILLVVLVDSTIWLFGIHAITILAVMKPIWLAMLTQNMEAALSNQPIPNIAPREFYIWFVWMGGSGASLALVAHLLRARSAALRSIAKVGLVPSLFNINDPLMFGVPVVMNPTLAVPFVVAPLLCATNAWLAFHFGMVTRPHLDILWTLPAPIGAFGSTGDPKALLLLALNLGVAYLVYAPFVRAYDRRQVELEAHAAATPARRSNRRHGRRARLDTQRTESPSEPVTSARSRPA
jgi:PTS system cellobiose-specific IIC component